MTPSPLVASSPRLLVCLCAAWCRTCDGYREVFAQVSARFPDRQAIWLDIEDQADLLGDVEVETFPTVLLTDGAWVQFFGTLTPHAGTLQRLLESAQPPARGHGPGATAEVQAFAKRLAG